MELRSGSYSVYMLMLSTHIVFTISGLGAPLKTRHQ
ncbi:hypothetical protein FAIPA1_310024 [Frankia sp. AiPs1]